MNKISYSHAALFELSLSIWTFSLSHPPLSNGSLPPSVTSQAPHWLRTSPPVKFSLSLPPFSLSLPLSSFLSSLYSIPISTLFLLLRRWLKQSRWLPSPLIYSPLYLSLFCVCARSADTSRITSQVQSCTGECVIVQENILPEDTLVAVVSLEAPYPTTFQLVPTSISYFDKILGDLFRWLSLKKWQQRLLQVEYPGYILWSWYLPLFELFSLY